MARRSNVHVSYNPGKKTAKVTQGGSRLSDHHNQRNAIVAGRGEVKRDRVDLVVHGRDGRIRSKDSYGRDPNPPRILPESLAGDPERIARFQREAKTFACV